MHKDFCLLAVNKVGKPHFLPAQYIAATLITVGIASAVGCYLREKLYQQTLREVIHRLETTGRLSSKKYLYRSKDGEQWLDAEQLLAELRKNDIYVRRFVKRHTKKDDFIEDIEGTLYHA